MTKADITLWAAIAGAIIALVELMTKHVGSTNVNQAGSPFTLSTGAPVFNIGGGRAGGSMAAPALPSRSTGGCGCGDGFGDYAIPRLPASVGELLRPIPLMGPPTRIAAEFPLLTNGASV